MHPTGSGIVLYPSARAATMKSARTSTTTHITQQHLFLQHPFWPPWRQKQRNPPLLLQHLQHPCGLLFLYGSEFELISREAQQPPISNLFTYYLVLIIDILPISVDRIMTIDRRSRRKSRTYIRVLSNIARILRSL